MRHFLFRALVYIIPALVMAVVVSLPRFVEVEKIILTIIIPPFYFIVVRGQT